MTIRPDSPVHRWDTAAGEDATDPGGSSASVSVAKDAVGEVCVTPFSTTGLYRYIGPKGIAERSPDVPAGMPIRSPADVRAWVVASRQQPGGAGLLIATFVIDQTGTLLVADRHSEHVACAGRQPVLSAGEITFRITRQSVEVAEVSNQSTGYCPEPESWPAVASALVAAGFNVPDGFSPCCVFRSCTDCGQKNLVKDGVFECQACGEELPGGYNCQ